MKPNADSMTVEGCKWLEDIFLNTYGQSISQSFIFLECTKSANSWCPYLWVPFDGATKFLFIIQYPADSQRRKYSKNFGTIS